MSERQWHVAVFGVACALATLSFASQPALAQAPAQAPPSMTDRVREAIEQGMREAEAERARAAEEAAQEEYQREQERLRAGETAWLIYDYNCHLSQVRVELEFIILQCRDARFTDPREGVPNEDQMYYVMTDEQPEFAAMAITVASSAFASDRRLRLIGSRRANEDARSRIGYTQTPRLTFIQFLDAIR